jgi:hypothetical protein
VVESTGLEIRRACKRTVGSNPTLSATPCSPVDLRRAVTLASLGSADSISYSATVAPNNLHLSAQADTFILR